MNWCKKYFNTKEQLLKIAGVHGAYLSLLPVTWEGLAWDSFNCKQDKHKTFEFPMPASEIRPKDD